MRVRIKNSILRAANASGWTPYAMNLAVKIYVRLSILRFAEGFAEGFVEGFAEGMLYK